MIMAFPHPPLQHGGPRSFQARLMAELSCRGWEFAYPDDDVMPDAVLVVGGTKRLIWLYRMRRAGVPIIYRLDGLSWLHRKRFRGIRAWLLGEVRNLLMNIIRSYFATVIVYQSNFVKSWWEQRGWSSRARSSVVYNGIDLDEFTPQAGNADADGLSIVCVEGTLDYSPFAVELLNIIQERAVGKRRYGSLTLYGSFEEPENRKKLSADIDYRGVIPREKLQLAYRNCVYLSLDVNPACPNTVIEALASGIPVIGFDTGALGELVSEGAGQLVPYGGDGPWELGFPDVDQLIVAAMQVQSDWSNFSANARRVAEERFDIKEMVSGYLAVIGTIEKGAKSEQLENRHT